MAGSACYNIVYMRERVGASNTYRVTGGGWRCGRGGGSEWGGTIAGD